MPPMTYLSEKIQVLLDPPTMKKLARRAEKEDRSLSHVARAAIVAYLKGSR